MPNILDDLFQWAAEQSPNNITTVRISITTNETTQNIVSYAEGSLTYYPGLSLPWVHIPPSFKSANDGVMQYFSNNRYGPSGSFTTFPFDADPKKTDPLTVSISSSFLVAHYTITLHSSKLGFTESFTPNFDAASNVIYGNIGKMLMTVNLCDRNTQPPPR